MMRIWSSPWLVMSRPAWLAAGADDRVDGVREGLPLVADLGVELHADKRILLLFGPAEPGQFRTGGPVHRQQEVAVVWQTPGTGADVAVHEMGILAQ